MWKENIERHGFAILLDILSSEEIDELSKQLEGPDLRRNRAGIRHALGLAPVAAIARGQKLMKIAKDILGNEALPIRATLFDKSPLSNWLVVWHQDTALPLRERREKTGWGPWSVKDGVNYAHAPMQALQNVLALRVHLDDSTASNGPLRVLPDTHKFGVLTDDQIHGLAELTAPVSCIVPRCGVLAMRPLVIHASSKSTSEIPRRVLHIEYASSSVVDGDMELAIA
jgi:ectoine hydroxylase-related dioxygenase (phytanoyl-CoA dioxygenase family)